MKKILFINLLGLTLICGCLQNSGENVKNNNKTIQSIIAYLEQEGISVTNNISVDECIKRYDQYDKDTGKKYCNALKQSEEEFFQWLKLAEKDPDIRNERGKTLLMEINGKPADEKMQIALTKILLQKGANPNLTDSTGKTALMYACDGFAGDLVFPLPQERVNLLLQAGANPNEVDKKGQTALFYAVHSYQDKIVPLLLKAGANPNIANSNGFTPLHQASSWGLTEIVRMLLEAGANPNLKDKKGHTPLWEIEHHGKINSGSPSVTLEVNSITKLLIDAGAKK